MQKSGFPKCIIMSGFGKPGHKYHPVAKLNVSQFAFTFQFSKLMFTKYTTYTPNMTSHVQWWRKAANTGEDIPVIS